MKKNLNAKEARRKMEDLADEIHICMFCTMSGERFMHSRPMTTLQVEEDGPVWFFTNKQTEVAGELNSNQHVCLNYSDPRSSAYLCIVGNAAIVEDPDKVKELWDPIVGDFFPDGISDNDLALIKVTPVEASYWDVHSKKMETLFEMIDSMLSHDKSQESEHGKLNF